MRDLVSIMILFVLSFVGFPLSASIERDIERNGVKFFGEIVPLYYDDDTDGLRLCPTHDHAGEFFCVEQDVKGNGLFSRKTLLYSSKDRTLKQMFFISHRFPLQMRASEKRGYFLRLQMSLNANNSRIGDCYSYNTVQDGSRAQIIGNGIIVDCRFHEDGCGQNLVVRIELKPGWREHMPPPQAVDLPVEIFGIKLARRPLSRTKLVESSIVSSRLQDGKNIKRIIPCWKFEQPELLSHKYFDQMNCTFSFEDKHLVSVCFNRSFNPGDMIQYTKVKDAILEEAKGRLGFSMSESVCHDGRELYSGSRDDGISMCVSSEQDDVGSRFLSVEMALPWL